MVSTGAVPQLVSTSSGKNGSPKSLGMPMALGLVFAGCYSSLCGPVASDSPAAHLAVQTAHRS